MLQLKFEDFFEFNNNCTRGHRFKLKKKHARTNINKNVFSFRVVNIWNSLSPDIVDALLMTFKKKLSGSINLNEYCKGIARDMARER